MNQLTNSCSLVKKLDNVTCLFLEFIVFLLVAVLHACYMRVTWLLLTFISEKCDFSMISRWETISVCSEDLFIKDIHHCGGGWPLWRRERKSLHHHMVSGKGPVCVCVISRHKHRHTNDIYTYEYY